MSKLTKRSALKLIADFEHSVREHDNMGAQPPEDREGIQRRYDFEHTRLLTKLTQE
jgi:hypothetical protein